MLNLSRKIYRQRKEKTWKDVQVDLKSQAIFSIHENNLLYQWLSQYWITKYPPLSLTSAKSIHSTQFS